MERASMRRGFGVLGIGTLLLLGVLAGSPPALAESLVDSGRSLLGDLTIDKDPRAVALRVPLSTFTDVGVGVLRPFASAGTRSGPVGTLDDSIRLLVDERQAPQVSQRPVELGAGLVWKATEHLELFGEYRFLNLGREPEQPSFKAGLSIRLF